jgi:hypothetical protein
MRAAHSWSTSPSAHSPASRFEATCVLTNAFERFAPQVGGGHRVDEAPGVGTGKDEPVLAQQPSDDRGVAVRVPDEIVRAVVQEEERPARPVQASELASGDIGAFQMLRPRRRQRVQPPVQRLQGVLLLGGELLARHDQEVDVAELVGVARRERSVEVGALEVVPENGACPVDELAEHAVELRVGSRLRDGREATCDGCATLLRTRRGPRYSPSRTSCSGGAPSACTRRRRRSSSRSRCSGCDSHRFLSCPGSLGR